MIPKLPEYGFQAIPLSPDDHLQIEHLSYAATMNMVIEGTALNDKGVLIPFRFDYVTKAALTRILFQFKLGYSALISLTLRTSELAIPSGSCYCVVTLVKAITGSEYPQRQVLLNGYVESHVPMSFGNSYVQPILNDQFFIENIIIADPAAATSAILPCPDFTILNILSASFTFTSDANVGNRRLVIDYYFNHLFSHTSIFKGNHAASTSVIYNFSQNTPFSTSTLAGYAHANLMNCILVPGSALRIRIIGSQVGDQISTISFFCKRQTIPI